MMLAKEVKGDMANAMNIWSLFVKGKELKSKYGEENVSDLSIGNPIDPVPEEFNQALIETINSKDEGKHGYMPTHGYQRVRQAVADYLNNQGYFKGLTADHVCMTIGATGGINTALRAILNPKDEVILISPYFVEYPFYVKNHHGKIKFVEAKEDGSLDVQKIKKAVSKKTKAILINSPNNPTGKVYSKENLEDLVNVLKDTGICVISDELYREILLTGKFTSIASLYDNSFMVYSFSKYYSMAGERIGYLAVNPKMEDIKDVMAALPFCNRIRDINAPATMQRVAEKLLNVPAKIDHYKAKTEKIINALTEYGYEFVKPEGTFYTWVKCPVPEEEFIQKATEKKLLVAPGSTFGKKGWFRIACCTKDQQVDLGLKILGELIQYNKI